MTMGRAVCGRRGVSGLASGVSCPIVFAMPLTEGSQKPTELGAVWVTPASGADLARQSRDTRASHEGGRAVRGWCFEHAHASAYT
jgi:hypothetical protein